LKRALKKRVKAVLKTTTQWDNSPANQLNEVHPKVTRRAQTRAAMIGLAISMGAASLLMTRQSDQAQASAPVGSQKAASSIPVVSEAETKFTPVKLVSLGVSSATVVDNSAVPASPTAASQVSGLEAKWQIAANDNTVEIPASSAVSMAKLAEKNSINLQPQLTPALNDQTVPSNETADNSPNAKSKFQRQVTVNSHPVADAEIAAVDDSHAVLRARLKSQQESALNRLQEKSHVLRESLAQLRPEANKNLPSLAEANPSIAPESLTGKQTVKAISQPGRDTSVAMPQLPIPVASTVNLASQSVDKTYSVKPGDTLAAIASNYGITVAQLAQANNLKNPNQLQINQKLVIPVKVGDRYYTEPSRGIQPAAVPTTVIAMYPARNLNTRVNSHNFSQPVTTSTEVFNHKSAVIPTLSIVAQNVPNQLRQNVLVTPGGINSNSAASGYATPYGIGGDSPIPQTFPKLHLPQTSEQKVAKVTRGNMRLRSLQAEIERLREKYRAQEAGIVTPAVPEENTEKVISNSESNLENKNSVWSHPNLQLNAIQITVPQPVLPGYNRPLSHTTSPLQEPINPEFLPNLPKVSTAKHYKNRISYAPIGVNPPDSLGTMRGTTVAPELPPLPPVNQYLPQPGEEKTFMHPVAAKDYIWPAKGVLTSGYGWRWGRMHKGIDIANSIGTPIYAAAPGVIERAGWNNGGYGNVVDIRHPDGSLTRYGHNSRILVRVGQQVQQGEQIAAMGSTGFSTGPHSHFEIHPAGKGAVNPIAFLPNRPHS
jgi:murein DD-endopeptidase MepM/ murein hydrolase activator NlpD